MKKILIILLVLVSSVIAQPRQDDLMGLGLSPELSQSIGRENQNAWRFLLQNIGLANNQWLVARNAANTANQSILRLNSNNDLEIRWQRIGASRNAFIRDPDFANSYFQFTGNATDTQFFIRNESLSGVSVLETGNAYGLRFGTNTNLPVLFRANSQDRWEVRATGALANLAANGGDLILNRSGTSLAMQEGTPTTACMGVATPNGTTSVSVTTSCATISSRVFYTRAGAVANMGSISTTVAPNGTGFSFASTGASDTLASSVVWMIVKAAS